VHFLLRPTSTPDGQISFLCGSGSGLELAGGIGGRQGVNTPADPRHVKRRNRSNEDAAGNGNDRADTQGEATISGTRFSDLIPVSNDSSRSLM
jgi:hypothetical protein